MAQIFISHAAADAPLVGAFVDLLQTGGDLRADDVFCTSIDGMGIETGEAFLEWIRENLLDARLVILLCSPNFFASRFCVAEMGAAWGSGLDVFPIVLSAMPRDVGAVFLGRQTARLDDAGLDELRDRLVTAVDGAAKTTGRWNLKKEEFLRATHDLIQQLPQPELVEVAQLEAEQAKVAAGQEIDAERRRKIQELEQAVDDLKALKNREAVEKWEADRQPPDERWKKLVMEARDALGEFDGPALRSTYATFTGKHWDPDGNTWEYWRTEIVAGIERQIIQEVDDHLLMANADHPRVRAALSALKELQVFVQEEMTEEMTSRLEAEMHYPIDLENRELWEDLLLGGSRFLD